MQNIKALQFDTLFYEPLGAFWFNLHVNGMAYTFRRLEKSFSKKSVN